MNALHTFQSKRKSDNVHKRASLKILIWQPIYRQPVYVSIYLPLAPAPSNYRLETKKHNLKSFCNE